MKNQIIELLNLPSIDASESNNNIWIRSTNIFLGISTNSIDTIDQTDDVFNIITNSMWITIYKQSGYLHIASI